MITVANSRPLALCNVIRVSWPALEVHRVDVGHQRHLFQERAQRLVLGAFGVGVRGGKQLLHVLHPRLGVGIVLVQILHVVGGLEDGVDHVRRHLGLRDHVEPVEHVEKRAAARGRRRAQAVAGFAQGLEHRDRRARPPSASTWSMVVLPIPRRGTLMMRFTLNRRPGSRAPCSTPARRAPRRARRNAPSRSSGTASSPS